ncbi:Nudix hydrolase 15, mitochondrial [Phytophthora pseudosyringae]|uniref:Nudix hydrolase 15, mitochondrial n=1 Tax=Phytophthora pseudosyringae TaxID=221518 RepID=A0A8T1VIP5_9STRA|nr:Nudix hydrolase 15, mitochondrial [Phytophthora pseudosyringae]
MAPLPPPAPTDEAPKKKRRTLRDAEADLEVCRSALQEAKRKLVLTARENAKMKVLLMKYIEKDDSLLCSSQLSVGESSSQPVTSVVQASSPVARSPPAAETDTSALSQSPREYTTAEEDSEENLWNNDFQPCGDGFTEPISQLSQISQASHWSELSSTSNLDAIINFLETQDTSETNRVGTLQAEYAKLREQKTVVRVGVGVLLMSKRNPDCVLIGQRKGSHGEGKFALPGGHLEMYESWEECAIREVKEETDLDLTDAKFATVTNDPMEDEGKHYITILMQAVVDDEQTVRNMEPNKCEGWSWVSWADLRSRDDMFTPLLHVTRSDFTPTFIKP